MPAKSIIKRVAVSSIIIAGSDEHCSGEHNTHRCTGSGNSYYSHDDKHTTRKTFTILTSYDLR